MTILSYQSHVPRIAPSVFIAEGVRIIGNVEIAEDSSCWYNTVIRGDVNSIRIGKRTNIQDNSVLHVNSGIYSLVIGDKVTVGHNCILHGCTLEDSCLIGMGACVLDGAVIHTHAFVGAGALVKAGMVVPSGVLVLGVPARIIRDLRHEEIEEIENSAHHYYEWSRESMKSTVVPPAHA